MDENDLSKLIFDLGLKIHKILGPGLLESAYEECLYYEILKQGIEVEKQKKLPLIYEDVQLEVGYRVDLLIEKKRKYYSIYRYISNNTFLLLLLFIGLFY